MTIFVQSPSTNNWIDGCVASMVLRFFDQVANQDAADVIVVPIVNIPNFEMNPALLGMRKPYVIFDYSELEWNYFDKGEPTLVFGRNAKQCQWLKENWHPFDDFVRDNPPVLYLKRELLAKDASDYLRPIDWPCMVPIPEIVSEEEYNARPIEIFFSFGYSHPSRPKLHGDIFHAMADKGINVIDSADVDHLGKKGERVWYSIYTPFWSRYPIEQLIAIQQQAKISVSLPGAGIKCFRHSTSPVGCVMAKPRDELAWSYPWLDTENCTDLNPKELFADLEAITFVNEGLYPVYVRSQDTIRKYEAQTYVNNYLTPLMEQALSK